MSSLQTIPSVSLKNILNNNIDGSEDYIVARKLGEALESTGFVYLTDHGISEEKVQRLFDTSVDYFKLPVTEKNKIPRDFVKTYHGYSRLGEEKFATDQAIELRETFDISVQNREDLSYPQEFLPELKQHSLDLIQDCQALAKVVLRLISISMELENTHPLINYHQILNYPGTQNYSQLRTLYYPAIKPTNGSEARAQTGKMRCGQHTDFGTFTFLFQDPTGGLEVLDKEGQWINVRHQPGSVLMNTADLLEVWSGGRFKSTMHRVIVPEEEVRRQIPRQSIAYFLKPDNATVVTPLIPHENPEKLQLNNAGLTLNAGEHFRNRTKNHRITQKVAVAVP